MNTLEMQVNMALRKVLVLDWEWAFSRQLFSATILWHFGKTLFPVFSTTLVKSREYNYYLSLF